MKLKNILTAAAVLAVALGAMAAGLADAQAASDSPDKEAAFGDGEQLTYVVSYRAALVPNLEAGEVNIRTTATTVDGVAAYNIHGNAKVFSHFKWVYDLDDTYQTWLDQKTLKPLKYDYRIREGKYRVNANYSYDWANNQVHTYYHNLKRETGKSRTLKLSDNSFDALALFSNFRSQDMSGYAVGRTGTIKLVLQDTIRTLQFKYLGKEQYTVKKLGTFNTLKFSCTIATSDGERFEDGSEFFLWLTDDKNKMPIYLESPVKVGSVRVVMTKYSGLKYPLTSKIK